MSRVRPETRAGQLGWDDAEEWIQFWTPHSRANRAALERELRHALDSTPQPSDLYGAGDRLGCTPEMRQAAIREYDEGHYERCRAELAALKLAKGD